MFISIQLLKLDNKWMEMICFDYHIELTTSQSKQNNEEQIITGYPIDGVMGGGWVRNLSVVCLHNNAIVARGIMVAILLYGTPEPRFSAIYIVSSVGTSFRLRHGQYH